MIDKKTAFSELCELFEQFESSFTAAEMIAHTIKKIEKDIKEWEGGKKGKEWGRKKLYFDYRAAQLAVEYRKTCASNGVKTTEAMVQEYLGADAELYSLRVMLNDHEHGKDKEQEEMLALLFEDHEQCAHELAKKQAFLSIAREKIKMYIAIITA